jgi:hypothetical protein
LSRKQLFLSYQLWLLKSVIAVKLINEFCKCLSCLTVNIIPLSTHFDETIQEYFICLELSPVFASWSLDLCSFTIKFNIFWMTWSVDWGFDEVAFPFSTRNPDTTPRNRNTKVPQSSLLRKQLCVSQLKYVYNSKHIKLYQTIMCVLKWVRFIKHWKPNYLYNINKSSFLNFINVGVVSADKE